MTESLRGVLREQLLEAKQEVFITKGPGWIVAQTWDSGKKDKTHIVTVVSNDKAAIAKLEKAGYKFKRRKPHKGGKYASYTKTVSRDKLRDMRAKGELESISEGEVDISEIMDAKMKKWLSDINKMRVGTGADILSALSQFITVAKAGGKRNKLISELETAYHKYRNASEDLTDALSEIWMAARRAKKQSKK